MRGAIPPLPQYIFIAWCLVKHGDSFTFTFNLGMNGVRRKGGRIKQNEKEEICIE
jgi:hypothetical protein